MILLLFTLLVLSIPPSLSLPPSLPPSLPHLPPSLPPPSLPFSLPAFPEIITPPRINSEVVKGENLTLDCETASQRPPDYVWSFEGEELVNNSRVSVGTTTGQLNISNVTFADTGTYNCFVQNDLGNDTQNSTVLVAGEVIVCVCVCVCVCLCVCISLISGLVTMFL